LRGEKKTYTRFTRKFTHPKSFDVNLKLRSFYNLKILWEKSSERGGGGSIKYKIDIELPNFY
jgi:hypothetical protein